MSVSEDVLVARLTQLIKDSTPSIERTGDGLSISQNGKTFEIPFSKDNSTISKTTLSKL